MAPFSITARQFALHGKENVPELCESGITFFIDNGTGSIPAAVLGNRRQASHELSLSEFTLCSGSGSTLVGSLQRHSREPIQHFDPFPRQDLQRFLSFRRCCQGRIPENT